MWSTRCSWRTREARSFEPTLDCHEAVVPLVKRPPKGHKTMKSTRMAIRRFRRIHSNKCPVGKVPFRSTDPTVPGIRIAFRQQQFQPYHTNYNHINNAWLLLLLLLLSLLSSMRRFYRMNYNGLGGCSMSLMVRCTGLTSLAARYNKKCHGR